MKRQKQQRCSLRIISQENYVQLARSIHEHNAQVSRKLREHIAWYARQLRGEGLSEEEILETVVWATMAHYREEGVSQAVLEEGSPSISQMVKEVLETLPWNTEEERKS